MDNNILFKALSSQTRTKMLKILSKEEIHISGLARKLKISVPVASKHIKILDNARLINKRKIGNVHLLSAKSNSMDNLLEQFAEKSFVKIKKDDTLIEALKQVPGIDVKEVDGKLYVTSINGEEGYYLYEVDGVLPKVSIDEYKPKKNVNLNLKKIITVNKKKIMVQLNK